jgi:hypothetical protein
MHLALLALLCGIIDADAARAVFAKAQKSVVTVRLVVKLVAGGHDSEQKIETSATVIDPSGLTVIPAAAADPAAMMRTMMRSRPGSPEVKFESSVTEAMILLPDGTEIESDVVLKDADLDLAFLRPREGGRIFDAVLLKPGKGLPPVLDQIILVGRYGQDASRAAWSEIVRMRGIVKGPRTYGLVDSGGSDALGTVAYSADGTALGVFVTKTSGGGGPEVRRMGGGDEHVILRPVDDVLEIAEQARKQPRPLPAVTVSPLPATAVAPISKPAPAPVKK